MTNQSVPDDDRTSAAEVWFARPDKFGDQYLTLLLEQYKTYVESADHISDRRGTAHTLLLTVNTTLIAAYGLVSGKSDALVDVGGPWLWVIPLLGISVSLAWYLLIRSYRTLNLAKYLVVHEIEKRLPARLFELERQMYRGGKKFGRISLSDIERFVPGIFALFYFVLLMQPVFKRYL